jgi:hypothetical protein
VLHSLKIGPILIACKGLSAPIWPSPCSDALVAVDVANDGDGPDGVESDLHALHMSCLTASSTHSCTIRLEPILGTEYTAVYSYGHTVFKHTEFGQKWPISAKNTEYTTEYTPYAEWPNPFGATIVQRDIELNRSYSIGVRKLKVSQTATYLACQRRAVMTISLHVVTYG